MRIARDREYPQIKLRHRERLSGRWGCSISIVAVDLVDHHDIDLVVADRGEEKLQGRPLQIAARAPTIVIGLRRKSDLWSPLPAVSGGRKPSPPGLRVRLKMN